MSKICLNCYNLPYTKGLKMEKNYEGKYKTTGFNPSGLFCVISILCVIALLVKRVPPFGMQRDILIPMTTPRLK